MSNIDISVFERQANKFERFIHELDNNTSPLNFIDGNSVLVKEEGYKTLIPKQARVILNADEWDESWIGSGRIKERIFKVMDKSENLINFNSRINFRRHFDVGLKEYNSDSERVIYEIYKGNDDKAAFEHAVKVFGAKYPVLAYMFFVKDETKYLPTSPENFDRAFEELNIEFVMSHRCSWDNYCQYIELIREIGDLMPQYLDISHDVRLLDAHSFVWIIREKKYLEWGLDINTPMKPKKVIAEDDGLIKYQCPNCDQIFKKAGRCPECGQLIMLENIYE